MRLVTRPLVLLLALVLGIPFAAAQEGGGEAPEDAGDIVIAGPDGVQAAAQLSQATSSEATTRVMLASDATFADALASAILQQDGPLLLVPPTLPLPGEVIGELERLAPAEVTLLGGESAIGQDVEEELQRIGFATNRIAGATRFETATAIARTRPNAVTALLVRAFDASGGDGTGAWADSVSAGALSTQLGLPILLTASDELSGPTADYLNSSGIQTVIIIGGTSAVSTGIEQQLRAADFIVSRAAGETRFETALDVARVRRLAPSRAVLIDGVGEDGWQGGLAAARHAALEGAPILPVTDEAIPATIQAYLDQVQPSTLTCVEVQLDLCRGGGEGEGGGSAVVTFNPPTGSAIRAGEPIVVGVDDPERSLDGTVSVSSNCTVVGFPSPPQFVTEGSVNFGLTVAPEEPGGDQPRPSGAVPVQPSAGNPQPQPGATAQPVEENEPTPVDYPLSCEVTTTLGTADGGEQVDRSVYTVVDLRPRIRVSSFPLVEGATVAFTDVTGGPVDTWSWDFADGGTSSEQHPDHVFDDMGCYPVELEVTSSLQHWFDGSRFAETETRLIGIAPADADLAHVEMYVVEGFVPVPGAVVRMFDLDGNEVASATAGSDAVAVFNNGGASSLSGVDYGTYVFTVDGEDGVTVQTVAPGQTVCPGVQIGEIGDLTVNAQTDSADPAPIPGATVEITRDGFTFGGTTDENGSFTLTDLPVGTYTVEVRAQGFVTETLTALVEPDAGTTLEVAMTRN